MKKFLGIVSFAFIAGMAVPTVEAKLSFSKYTQQSCANSPLMLPEMLKGNSFQPNCFKGILSSFNGYANGGKAPMNFMHIMEVAKKVNPEVDVLFKHLLDLIQENLAKKIPFKNWEGTTIEGSGGGFEYNSLIERVAEALNPRNVELTSKDSIESKQLFNSPSNISTKDCVTNLSLALESALSSTPNKEGMRKAYFETGAKGSNPSFQFVWNLIDKAHKAPINRLFAVRSGQERISGPDLHSLLIEVHQIVHQYKDILGLYNITGTFNRMTCKKLEPALKSILNPYDNKNCWGASRNELNSRNSTLFESVHALQPEQQKAFMTVLAARGNTNASVPLEEIKILLNLLPKVSKSTGVVKSAVAYFALNKKACSTSLEKFFTALLMPETHKNCLMAGMESINTPSQHSPFYIGFRSSKNRVGKNGQKKASMVPGLVDLTPEEQELFVKLARVRLGQEAIAPEARQKIVLGVMEAYMRAKKVAFKRYTESLPKVEQAAAIQDEKHDLGTTLLAAATALGEQSQRLVSGDSAAHESFLAELRIILDALKRLQVRADAEHRGTFEAPIVQLQRYADELEARHTTPQQVEEIEQAGVSAAAVGILAITSDDSAQEEEIPEFDSPATQERKRIESLPTDVSLAHQPLAITAPQQQVDIVNRVHGTQENQEHNMDHSLPVDSHGRPVILNGIRPVVLPGTVSSAGTQAIMPIRRSPLAIMPPPSVSGGNTPTAASLLAGEGTTTTDTTGLDRGSEYPTFAQAKEKLGNIFRSRSTNS